MTDLTKLHNIIWITTMSMAAIAIVSFIVYSTKLQNDRERMFEEGCKRSEGKLYAPMFQNVNLYKNEKFMDFYEQLIEASMLGDITPEQQAKCWKAVDKGELFFSVSVNTKVRFSNSLREDDSRIEVTVLEGRHKGRTGWIRSNEYGCQNWYGVQEISGDSHETLMQSIINRRFCKFCGVKVTHDVGVHQTTTGIRYGFSK